jgi:hypothetical protein
MWPKFSRNASRQAQQQQQRQQRQQQHWWSCRKNGASSMRKGRRKRMTVDHILHVVIAMVLIITFGIANVQQEVQYSIPIQRSKSSSISFEIRQATNNASYFPAIASHNPMNNQEKRLWHNNPNLPSWLRDYMSWHQDIVANKLTNITKHDYKYIVLRCYSFDERCGGVSDRLKPIPLILMAAAQSQRVFFIHWHQRPYPLEEFLMPPPGGLNWSVPHFLVPDFLKTKKGAITRAGVVVKSSQKDGWIKPVHIHDAHGGSTQYDELDGSGSFLNIFHDLFRILFRPSNGLDNIIQQMIKAGGNDGNIQLIPGKYSVAHYRAEYGKEVDRHPIMKQPSFVQNIAFNAVKCAIQLQPGDPIYFASDNMMALNAVRRIAAYTKYPILTFNREETVVLRLDDTGMETSNINAQNQTWINPYLPSDYYSTFVDLYLAGNGNCVTFGRGGFGRFASLLSYNASCAFKHVKQFFAVPCRGYPPLDMTVEQLATDGVLTLDR